jgi:hypothetical protein
MKKILLFTATVIFIVAVNAQNDKSNYPDPEFSNEVYRYQKDKTEKLARLEKGASKMDTKTKLAGFGGSESNYIFDGNKSTVRFTDGSGLRFIFSIGPAGETKSNPQADSAMRANGIDPSMMKGFGSMMDPSNMITLYSVEQENDRRKILMMKSPGMLPFGSKKVKSSEKYSFSVKKIRDGYWELVVDKTLPKGEYAFTVMGMGMEAAQGGVSIYAFAID